MTFIPKTPLASHFPSKVIKISLQGCFIDGVGEKPKPFSRNLISALDYTFLLILNTESEEKEPLMLSLSVSKKFSLLTPND